MTPPVLRAAAFTALLLAGPLAAPPAARAQDAAPSPDRQIATLRAAAEAIPIGAAPREWAAAQLQLGETLWMSAQAGGDLGQADEAISVWRGALRDEVRAADALLTAQTEIRLAGALTGLGRQRQDIALVQEAARHARSALSQPAFSGHAAERAAAQATLGDALLLAGQVQGDTAALAGARVAFDAARAAMGDGAAPSPDLATTWLRAGVADALIAQITGGAAHRQSAIAAFRAAETVYTALGDGASAQNARDNVVRLDALAPAPQAAAEPALTPAPALRR